jgi:hypothetical protein
VEDTVTWDARWANFSDKELNDSVYTRNEERYERYSRTILLNLRPTNTLDIGGGTGGLGAYLPGKYTVMDHPRMKQFCKWANWIPIGPIEPGYDLVVSTNAMNENPIPVMKAYIDQIEAAGIPYLYLNGRKYRQGTHFKDWPIGNWEPIVLRGWGGKGDRYMEFLGKLKR